MTKTRNLDRAVAHLTNYAADGRMTLRVMMDRYMDDTLPAIKREAIGRIMARYPGVTTSDIYGHVNDL